MENKEIDIDDLICRYLSRIATCEETDQLKQWLMVDESNVRYFLQMKNIWEVSSPVFNPEEINVSEAWGKLSGQTDRKSFLPEFIRLFQQIAAILIIPVVFLSIYLLFIYNRQDSFINQSYQEIFVPYGTYSSVLLPDSSIVWLNAGSSIKYPTIFQDNKRNVYLEGEAYFEVKANPERPFIVHTDKMDIVATGTAFNVQSYGSDTITTVTMVEGKVSVADRNELNISILPGEQIRYNLNTSQHIVSQTNPYKWCAWKDGLMIFRDDPLEYVFKRLELTFNVEIALKDQSIADNLYRATFEVESLDEILCLLKMTAPIYYKEQNRKKRADNSYEKRKIEVYKTK